MPDIENKPLETVDLPGEEVFSAGKWTSANGKTREYSIEDLAMMASAANETSYKDKPVKLGHNEQQKAIKELFGDGAPAAGWIQNFRVVGQKLIADFVQVPKQIADLVAAGAYKQKSLEIWDNFKDEALGKVYKMMPCAVALLGAELPAVSNLNSLMQQYSLCESSPATQFLFKLADSQAHNTDGGDMQMTPEEIKAMQEENASMKEKCSKLEAENADLKKASHAKSEEDAAKDKEIADLKEKLDAAEKANHAKAETADARIKALEDRITAVEAEKDRYAKEADAMKATDRQNFLDKHVEKLTPAMRASYAKQFELSDRTPETFKFSKGDGDAKQELTGEEAIRAEIEALPKNPLLETYGKQTDRPGEEQDVDEMAAIETYCKAHSLDINKSDDFVVAYSAVKRGEK